MSSSNTAESLPENGGVEYPEGSSCDLSGASGLGGPVTGRVVLGMGGAGPSEMSIQAMEGKRKLVWDSGTDDEYFDRVRSRATQMAREILGKAMAEAEELKARAVREGHEEGLDHARAEVEAHIQALAEATQALLGSIQDQGRVVYGQQRTDLIALIRLAVEKTLRVEMDDRRIEILASLLDEALEKIDAARSMTLVCAAQDMELLETLLHKAAEARPEIAQWRIRSGLPEQGGVVIETDEGMVDNGLPSRWQGVEEIFDKLAASGNPDRPETTE